MGDYVLINGDKATFLQVFGDAIVGVQPASLQGSGPATLNGQKLCVDGDEKNVKVQGCTYFTPVYSIPGTGTVTIQQLAGNQKAQKTQTDSKAVLLAGQGSMFTASFQVQSPAKQPPPGPGSPTPDSTTSYSGQGQFTTTNTAFKGV